MSRRIVLETMFREASTRGEITGLTAPGMFVRFYDVYEGYDRRRLEEERDSNRTARNGQWSAARRQRTSASVIGDPSAVVVNEIGRPTRPRFKRSTPCGGR